MDLCRDDLVLMFHSRSKDAPPGEGVGESLSPEGHDFSALAAFTDWRQKLSNFAPAPFALDGLRWASVEHCFQASKFVESDPDYYRGFSLDSGSALSRADGSAAKRAGGRGGRPMTSAQIAWWETAKWAVMRRALEAKYRANDEHRAILLATWPAKLTHRPLRASHTQVERGLMEVRALLRDEALATR
ncbi:MAG: NADAR family protein [Polyangiales bacterium]